MDNQPKFNKSFEALYKTAMTMADSCVVKNEFKDRYEKLFEEYTELMTARFQFELVPARQIGTDKYAERLAAVKDELGEVLFVLLHVAHKYGFDAFELLHATTSKMLARMNDKDYIAKN